MSIVSTADVLAWLDIEEGYYTIVAVNNKLLMDYNEAGSDTTVTLTSATYTPTTMAAHLKSVIDTALSSSVTVTYSTTTEKFTIDSGAGNTIALTLVGSTAALTIGFSADKADARTITSDLPSGDPTSIADAIHTHVEKWVKTKCRRSIESASFTERYDGKGTQDLFLKEYPVTAIASLAIGTQGVINIWNTNTTSRASVSVSSTLITLTRDGSADATVDYATYATMAAVVTQINTVGSGWAASMSNTAYNDYKSTELVPKMGLNVLDSRYVELQIPTDDSEDDFDIDENAGIITNNTRCFPKGNKNIYVNYTAGYSSTTMPEDLKMAVKILITNMFQKREEETFGTTVFSAGDTSGTLESNIPQEVRKILSLYRRHKV